MRVRGESEKRDRDEGTIDDEIFLITLIHIEKAAQGRLLVM
jgi:hypothetical protein